MAFNTEWYGMHLKGMFNILEPLNAMIEKTSAVKSSEVFFSCEFVKNGLSYVT
jgi:hypothetical protein